MGPREDLTAPPGVHPEAAGAVLVCDYLVVGAGAAAMAFVDSLLTEQPDATVVVVDRHDRPGGHWNDAYPFARLHQPSEYYGVASRELSRGTTVPDGPDRGMPEAASDAQVVAYLDELVRERFLPSGRVGWLPKHELRGGTSGTSSAGGAGDVEIPGGAGGAEHRPHRAVSLVSGAVTVVRARRLVDATHARTTVPSTHRRAFAVADEVACVPVGALVDLDRPRAAYTVLGAGKTGIDAVLWLLGHGVPPARVRWVVPRDAWFINRDLVATGPEHALTSLGAQVTGFEALAAALSAEDYFLRQERAGLFMRLDTARTPTTYHCATVSPGELDLLRGVEDVVRLGRVRAVEPTRVVLDHGSVAADPDTLYVDCTASAVQPVPDLPVFDGERVNLLWVRYCQPLFSAALIAWVESHVEDPAERAAMTTVVPVPDVPADVAAMWETTLANAARWQQHDDLVAWIARSRLDTNTVLLRDLDPQDPAVVSTLEALGAGAAAAAGALPSLRGASV